MSKEVILSDIITYPVKSLGGIYMGNARVKERGLQFDRRWMLVDTKGKCITQRENVLLADLTCSINNDFIIISSKSRKDLKHMMPLEISDHTSRLGVQVWDSSINASLVGKEADEFFSEAIGQSCHIVFIDQKSKRKANQLMTGQKTSLSFADAYPYLILSKASLEDLNTRLDKPVEMDRFRPNLVIDGLKPYGEDSIKEIKVSNIRFKIVKPCPRCVIPTIDPQTYKFGKEPLKTLATYRTVGNQVMFGVNAIALDYGKIQVQDPVEILA
jgi:uncharacterized protein